MKPETADTLTSVLLEWPAVCENELGLNEAMKLRAPRFAVESLEPARA